MKKLFLYALCIFASFQMQAAHGFNVKVNIQNNTDTLIYLCHYYGVGKTVYKDDSVRTVPNSGKSFTFKKDTTIVGGIYIILFSDRASQLEFLLSDGDNFEITFDKNDLIGSAKFKNNDENTHFYDYQKYVQQAGQNFSVLQAEMANARTKADTLKVNDKMTKLSKDVNTFRLDFIKKYPTSLGARIFNALQEPEVPTVIPMLADGKTKDSTYAYRYFKSHYWDNFAFKDERLVYTPLFDPKLESYFGKLVVSTPDSFNKESDAFLKNFGEKQELYKYSLWWLTRYCETSKIMGMDESFVYLVEKYYMQGKAYWLADSDLQKYITSAQKLSPNVVGKQAPEIKLNDINNNPMPLSSVVGKADFTIVAFYDPTCHHCQQEIPSMDSLTRIMNKKRKVQIYGIENANEEEKWKKFIEDKKLNDFWYHIRPDGIDKYRSNYNVYSNPIFYLIDKSGKIVGKRFDHTNLEGLIEFIERRAKEIAKEKAKQNK
jgi:peroxiredoxin